MVIKEEESAGSVKLGSERMALTNDIDLKKNHGSLNNGYVCEISILPFNSDIAGSDDGKEVNGVTFTRQRSRSIRKPTMRRLVEKNGKRNVRSKHIPRDRYMQDVFTTMIDAKWKWVILLFIIVYLGSWLTFAFIWWIIILVHGTKCIDNVTNFTESFLFSVETSMTIGYGGRAVTSQCPEGVITLIIQALASCLIDCGIIGLVFTKIARPAKRQSTVIFSDNAVITKRDDKFCLMFRVADVRKRHLVECHIRLYLFRTHKTLEGQVIHNHQDQLRVGCDWYNIRDDSDRLFLLFPCTVTHVIDRKSPLYNMTPGKLGSSDWELVVVLEGVVEATGSTMQARTSYIANEICWGYDFDQLSSNDEWLTDEGLLYRISRLNKIVPALYVPSCCPREYYLKVSKDPDPNDVYGEQDELWDDENFIEPGNDNRVLSNHLSKSLSNVIE